MEDQQKSQSVIVSSYLTRTKSILLIFVVVCLIYTTAQFQFKLIYSDSASKTWWISNVCYFLIVLLTIFNFIKMRNVLKHPLTVEVDRSPNPVVSILDHPKYAGQWMIKKKSTYRSQVEGTPIMFLLVLLLLIMDVVSVVHYLRTPRLQTPFQKESIVQQFEMAVFVTFMTLRYWLIRNYRWNMVLKQPGKTLVLYSKEKVGE